MGRLPPDPLGGPLGGRGLSPNTSNPAAWDGRSSGLREAGLGLAAYGAYMCVRRAVLTPAGRRRATHNAARVIALERRLGIDLEQRVQRAALRAPGVVHALHACYAAANAGLSVAWLIALHRRHDPAYRRERRAALVALVGALPVFRAFPLAPPRTQATFVRDTMAGGALDLDHPWLVRFYNPIAAMPSHHVAFAVVTGSGLAARASSPVARAAWAAYPALVAVAVVATGNHYVLDIPAGAALGAAARALTR